MNKFNIVYFICGILLIVGFAFGTIRTWDGGDANDGQWESDDNWSDNAKPGETDTAWFDNTSDKSCTTSQDVIVKGLYIKSDYNGNMIWANDYMTINGSYIDSGNGIRHWGDKLTLGNAAGCTLAVSSAINGEVTASACTLVVAAKAKRLVCKHNEYTQLRAIKMEDSSRINITSTMPALWIYGDARDMYTAGVACTLSCTGAEFGIVATGSVGRMCSIGAASVFTGSSTFKISDANPVTDTCGNIVSTGTVGTLTFGSGHAGGADYSVLSLDGNVSWGNNILIYNASANNRSLTFNQGSYNITTTGNILFGGAAAGLYCVWNCGSGTVTAVSYDGTTYNAGSGKDSLFMMTSTWNISGDYDHGTKKRVVPGTSTINFTGTTASTPTLSAGSFYDVNIRKGATNTVTVADSFVTVTGGDFVVDSGLFSTPIMTCGGDITINAGRFNSTGKCITDDFITVDGTVRVTDTLVASGNITWDSNDTAQVSKGIRMTGATGTLHLDAAIGVAQFTTCDIIMNTTNGVIDNDEAATRARILIGASDTVTSSGSTSDIVNGSTTPLIIGNAGRFIINTNLTLRNSGSGDLYSLGTGASIGGTAQLSINPYASANFTAPTLTSDGSGLVTINDGNTAHIPVVTQTGNISVASGSVRIYRQLATNSLTYYQAGQSITASAFSFGCNNATGTFNLHLKGTIAISGAINTLTHNSGVTTIADTAAWTVGTDFTWQTTHNYSAAPGQSLTLTGTGTLTDGEKYVPSKLVINSSGTVTPANAIKCDTLQLLASTLTTVGTGTDSVDNYLQLNGGSLTMGNPLVAGLVDIDDGTFYMGANPLTTQSGFSWTANDSLAWDGDITIVGDGDFVFGAGGTKFFNSADLDMKGSGNFNWTQPAGTRRISGNLTMGYAGKTVTWVGLDENSHPQMDGGQLIIADATGVIAGVPYMGWYINADDTPYNLNGATITGTADWNLGAYLPATITIGAINAPNISLDLRSWLPSAGAVVWNIGGDMVVKYLICNTQYNYNNTYNFSTYDITVGTSGTVFGNNGSAVTTLDKTSGTWTSTGQFSIGEAVTFNEGAGEYNIGGNLVNASITYTPEKAVWKLNGAGMQTISVAAADTLDTLVCIKTGGTASTIANLNAKRFQLADGTIDFSGDTLTAHTAIGAGGQLLYDAGSYWKILDGGSVVGFTGDTLPPTKYLGGGNP